MAKTGVAKKDAMNFNGGEISPLLEGRVDLDIYGRACRQLQNSIPRKYGNAERRVGTRFVAEAKYADKKCINISFDLSSTVSLNIEMGEYYFRFFRNGSAIMNGSSIYEVSHPYPESALSSVAFVQINDVVYMTHPDYPPYKLSHYADNNWTMIAVPFDEPVFMDMNTTSTTITPSGVSGSVTLTASSGIFNEGHIGAYFKLGQIRAANRVEISLLASGTSLPIELKGAFTVRTSGTWAGTLEVQRLNTLTSAWETIYTHISDQDRNVEASYKQEDVSAQWRLVYTFISKDSTSPKAYLESAESYVYGWAKVTAFASSTSVTALVADSFLNTTATNTWYEGAWSSYRGFPSACALFQQRMVYSGTYFQPQTIWGSVTNDYQNFEYGTDDDKAFQYTIGSQERLSTQWLCVHNNALIIGTSTGDWAMSGSNGGDDPVTPTNVIIRRQSTTGDARIQPVVVGNAILHVQRNDKKLYEMTYSIQSYGYDDQDISQFAEHITGDGIVGIAYQRQPDGIIYCVRSDGVLLMCVYDQAQKVIAWSRMVTQGFVESAAVIYGPVGDEVWLVVRRNVNGTWKRLIERLYPVLWDSKIDCWYLDCGYLAWNGGGGGGGGGGNGGYEPGNVVALEAAKQYALDIGYGKISGYAGTDIVRINSLGLYFSSGFNSDDGITKNNSLEFPMFFSADGINWIRATIDSALTYPISIRYTFETSIENNRYVSIGEKNVLGERRGSVIFGSSNGLLWHKITELIPDSGGEIAGASYLESSGRLFIGMTESLSGPVSITLYSSVDGISWSIFKSGLMNWTAFPDSTTKAMIYTKWFPSQESFLLDSDLTTETKITYVTGIGGDSIHCKSYLGNGILVGWSYMSNDYGLTWTSIGGYWEESPCVINNNTGRILGYTLWPGTIGTSGEFWSHENFLSNSVSYFVTSAIGGTKRALQGVSMWRFHYRFACSDILSDRFLVSLYDTTNSCTCFIWVSGNVRPSKDSETDQMYPDVINTKSKHLLNGGETVIIKNTGTNLDGHEYIISKVDDYSISLNNSNLSDFRSTGDVKGGNVIKKVHEITGLDELAGATVDANCDGDPVMDLTVDSSGTLTLPGYYDQVIVGLRYTSIIEPLAVQMSNETGSALSQTARIRGVDVRLKDTLGLKVTTDTLQYHEIVDVGVEADGGDIVYTEAVFRDTSDQISESPDLFTGILDVPLEQHHSKEPRVILKQEAPMPLNVLGMTFKYEITEPLSGKAQQ